MKNPTNNMNIFEDLIEELKEENLIEETVIKTNKAKKNIVKSESEPIAVEQPIMSLPEKIEEPAEESSDSKEELLMDNFVEPEAVEAILIETPAPVKPQPAKTAPAAQENFEEVDFYRKRAMDEVAFLQMVESAFAGIERDQMKIVPSFYDDLEVKKVLHSYLQVTPKASASERSQAEILLLQATENWYSTLAERDKRIMSAHLRRYCETSRPPLSMPALIALARFYRNAPYSEAVRCKFDMMLTRIFSEEEYNHKREINFSREELDGYIKELYAEWSSVPMYSTDEDDEGIKQTVTQFEEFVKEAKAAENFDTLINSNFFNRLRQFKESTNEDFYAPPVAAAAIELNVAVGNCYVELLEREKDREGIERVESKYGFINDSTVSEATSKTMTLIELLNQKHVAPEPVEEEEVYFQPPPEKVVVQTEAEKTVAKNTKYARWILIGLIGLILVVGVYYGISSFTGTTDIETSAPPLNLENSMLKDYLKEAWIDDDQLKGVVLPSWDKMSSEDRKGVLKKMLTFGGEKGYRRIELFNQKNKKIAIADDGGVYVVE